VTCREAENILYCITLSPLSCLFLDHQVFMKFCLQLHPRKTYSQAIFPEMWFLLHMVSCIAGMTGAYHHTWVFFVFAFLQHWVLGFQLIASCLLGRHSIT
jgi:hypothetical protein